MLSFLGNILSALEDFPNLILQGLVDMWNGLMGLCGTVASGAIALLPTMPSPPSFTGSTWLHWLNWIYPVGQLVAGVTALLVIFATYMAIRYVLQWARAL